jgi:PAS domain S-box-containing protein
MSNSKKVEQQTAVKKQPKKKPSRSKSTSGTKLRAIFEYEGVTRGEARTKEALREHEEKLRVIFETIAAGITITDLDGTIVEMNKGALHMHGFRRKKEQVIGRSGLELIAEKDRARAMERWSKNLEEGTFSEVSDHYTLLKADGTTFEAAVSEAVLRDKNGNPEGFISIARDITERKRAEEALRDSEEKLRTMFESIHDAVEVLELNGTFVDANEAAVQIRGFKRKEELIGRKAIEFVAEKDRDNALEYTKKIYKRGGKGTIEYTLVTIDGTELEAEFGATLLRDRNGEPVGFIGVTRDITERKQAEEALRNAEEELRVIFESIGDAITVTDLKGNIVQANEVAYRKGGYKTKEEFMKINGFELMVPEDRDMLVREVTKSLKQGKSGTGLMECRFQTKQGEYLAELQVNILYNSEGNPAGFIATSRDVTERKAAESARRESEEKLRAVFESVGDGITIIDLAGTIVDANEAAVRIGGHKSREDLIGRNGLEFIKPDEREKAAEAVMETIKTDLGSGTLQYTMIAVDGSEKAVEVSVAPMRDSSGKPVGFITATRDITERKQAEEALRESEEKLRVMFDSTSDGIIVLDPKLTVVEVNDAAVRIFGHSSKDEMLGKPGLEFMQTELHPEGEEDKGPKVELSVSQLRDKEGNLAGFISIARDVTIRKRMEQRLKDAMDDLKRSNRDLEQFAYVASHDLQEPLRMVSSYTQLLSRRYKGNLGEDADEFIEFAVDGANRMQGMIQALLAFSRVGTRGNPFEPTEGEAILEKALTNLKAAVEDSGSEITHDSLPTVSVDGIQIIQLFQNLIGNALKFRGDKPPKIHIGVEEREEDWLFSVSDNGIGIDPEYKERIFVIFQRLHGKGEYPGTGIGLALCKRIVERHGGRIWVDSEPGKGSTFSFTVPKEREEEEQEQEDSDSK